MCGYPPRLAVATKPGKRLVRVLLYELLGGGGNGLPRGATAMCTGQAQIADSLSVKVSQGPGDHFRTNWALTGQRRSCYHLKRV